jgi:hypothetical protein
LGESFHWFLTNDKFKSFHACPEFIQAIDPAIVEAPVGDLVKAIGWGMIADNKPGNVDNLREVDVPVVDDKSAAASYPGTNFETKICIDSKDGKGICSGDSGGPLMDNNKVGLTR